MYFYNLPAFDRHRRHEYYDVPLPLLVVVTSMMAAMVVAPVTAAIIVDAKQKSDKNKVYNSIVICDGEETREDNIRGQAVCKDQIKVVYKDDTNLTIFVYDNNIEKRYLFTEFVESNIYIIEEDGKQIVYLNPEDLTEEKYNEFVSNLSKNDGESRIQRKRS